jgi:hypothetical protein
MQNEETRWRSNSAFFILHFSFFIRLGIRLGLAEAGDPVAGLPLAAFLQDGGAFKTLENIAFSAEGGRCAQAAML